MDNNKKKTYNIVIMAITTYLSKLNFQKKAVIVIIFLAFIIRIAGISYGLPLWLIDDEPPFVLGAIKMIQLRALIPAFHQSEFEKILYYPPYLSYLYIIPFIGIIGFQYLLHYKLGDLFIPFLVSDLSQFFMTARFIMTIVSLISIFLIYKIGKNLFFSEKIGAVAAFLLSTSLLHIMLSITSRHWLTVSFFGLLIFFFLSSPKYESNKKYLIASAVAGIGMGFSAIIIAYLALIALWYLFAEKYPVPKMNILACVILFSIMAAFPLLLYPQSLGFTRDVTTGAPKTLTGIIVSPFLFLKPIALSEPILAFFAAIGLLALLFYRRSVFIFFFTLIYGYSALFYIAFRFEHRFVAGLLPFIALLAAYGFNKISELLPKKSAYALLIIPLIFSTQLSRVIANNDSRMAARNWIEKNIPTHEKILVYARLTRLSSDPTAIEEQRAIDNGSLRKVDEAEKALSPDNRNTPIFHALNLYSVNNEQFFNNISEYAEKNNYKYALISDEDFTWERKDFSIMQKFGKSGTLIKTFGSYQPEYSISTTQLSGSPLKLFKFSEFGPPLSLYKIPK